MEAPWPLESRRHPRLYQTVPVGIQVGGSVGREKLSMASIGSPLSSLDIVEAVGPQVLLKDLKGGNHVITNPH